MIKDLYIIGNGFDLHHGIDSSYSDFYEWMNKNYPDIINKVDNVYGNCDSHWWSDFENQLASLDAIRYGDAVAFMNQPDLSDEHCDRMWGDAEIAVQNELENLYSDLRFCFHKWIHQLKRPQDSQKIKLSITNAVFLSFNYTKTLEHLYGITSNRILHIHGCIDDNEDFILGHGKTYEELESLNTIDLPGKHPTKYV